MASAGQAGRGAALPQHRHAYRRLSVVRTRKDSDERLRTVAELALGADKSEGAEAPSIFVEPRHELPREWLGFGGSFTESAAVVFGRMPASEQASLLRAYFDRETGLGYTLGRVHIGSCDFALGNWTCGELVEGDMQLKGFSIRHYETAILPMLRRASEQAGGPISLLASPWSPPPWMKTSGRFNRGGKLLPAYRAAWALHYARFAEEMAKAGCPLWGVSVQNEPEAETPWDSCTWSAEEERDFVRDFLGPTLESAGLFPSLKIVIWDHNRDGMFERAAVAYSDPAAERYIWGVGYHWYGDARFEVWPGRAEVAYEDRARSQLLRNVSQAMNRAERRAKEGKPPEDEKKVAERWKRLHGMAYYLGLPSLEAIGAESARKFPELRARVGFDNVRRVADLRPDKHILFTEGCQELGGRPLASVMHDWELGERYGMNIISDMNSGCEGWIDWNLCLDEHGGPNHVGNMCVAPVICDTQSSKVHFLPPFWYLGHFSRYIRPGARRVLCASSRDALETTAFVNSDGSLAVVVMNQSGSPFKFWLKVAGSGAVLVDAPEHSISTFLMQAEDGSRRTAAL